ncbi:hypothetical protein EOW65_18035 [Sinirhodobacter ferrireducens]|uniref:Uncharacterized protein n=1 Tax=Paenirhodobacter ferrireducens TaxID=1215032 RepID=A0A443L6S4_9RHOB|nr:hypothetical protein [Sinirhodobacter ferrireducens]RWR44763.1 hypothetical protein EOW65_18035 [Sinirhodobacter ferrireducens]
MATDTYNHDNGRPPGGKPAAVHRPGLPQQEEKYSSARCNVARPFSCNHRPAEQIQRIRPHHSSIIAIVIIVFNLASDPTSRR